MSLHSRIPLTDEQIWGTPSDCKTVGPSAAAKKRQQADRQYKCDLCEGICSFLVAFCVCEKCEQHLRDAFPAYASAAGKVNAEYLRALRATASATKGNEG